VKTLLSFIEPSKSEYYIYYASALTIMFVALILVVFYILLKKAKQTTEEDEKEAEELFAKNNITKTFFDSAGPTLLPELTAAINSDLGNIETNILLRTANKSLLEMLRNKFYAIRNHMENSHLPVTRALRELLFIRLKLREIRNTPMLQ